MAKKDILFICLMLFLLVPTSASALNITLERNGGIYNVSGVFTTRYDSHDITQWQNISWMADVPENTTLAFRARTAASEDQLASAPWSAYIYQSGSSLDVDINRWIEIEVSMTTNDTSHSPALYSLEVHYGWSPPIQTENDGAFKTSFVAFNALTIRSVAQYTWHRNNMARIDFIGVTNLSGIANLNPVVEVGDRFAFVNSSAYRNLNKSANITLYGIDCTDPNAYRLYYSETGSTREEIISSGEECAAHCANIACTGGSDGYLTFTVSHFTGYAAGSLSNLTIYDEIEGGGTKTTGEPVFFYANYTSSGAHIPGASCNISFSDNPSLWYAMTDSGDDYEYYRDPGFSSTGTYDWDVACDHQSYNLLEANDTIDIVTDIPEFSKSALLLTLLSMVIGLLIVKRGRPMKSRSALLMLLVLVLLMAMDIGLADSRVWINESDFINHSTYSGMQLNLAQDNSCEPARYYSPGYDFPLAHNGCVSLCGTCDGAGTCSMRPAGQFSCPACSYCTGSNFSCQNVTAQQDPYDDCPGTCNTCAGNGSCGPVTAGEWGLPACQQCDGIHTSVQNITADQPDTQGSNRCGMSTYTHSYYYNTCQICSGTGRCYEYYESKVPTVGYGSLSGDWRRCDPTTLGQYAYYYDSGASSMGCGSTKVSKIAGGEEIDRYVCSRRYV